MTVCEEQKAEKKLTDRLPKKELHKMFGICFDKKGTYTTAYLKGSDFTTPITIGSVLKKAGITKESNKNIVIIYSRKDPWGNRQIVDYFNIGLSNNVLSYGGYCYRKSSVLPGLKLAEEVVVIQADRDSLKFPKERDSFYESRDFNDDSSLYERVKFQKRFRYAYNEEKDKEEKVLIAETEIRSYTLNHDIGVQFLDSGKKLNLHMTWGHDKEATWNDIIDKSGYNRKAKLVSNSFKLQAYKAQKARDRIKSGSLAPVQSEVVKLMQECKKEISLLIERLQISNFGTAKKYLYSLESSNRRYNTLQERVASIGTENEYTVYTISIKEDFDKLKSDLVTLLNNVKTTV